MRREDFIKGGLEGFASSSGYREIGFGVCVFRFGYVARGRVGNRQRQMGK